LICQISAKAFRKYYRQSDTITGILKYNRKEAFRKLEKVNLSTELAVKSGKFQNKRKLEEIVPMEYHQYLKVFEEGEKHSYHFTDQGWTSGLNSKKAKDFW